MSGSAGVSAAGGASGGAGAGAGSGGVGGGGLESVALFVMFDRSWSMTQCADLTHVATTGLACDDGGPSRWDLASLALQQFVEEPGSAGLGMALRFFPSDEPTPGCNGYSTQSPPIGEPNCDADACAKPLVDLGRLTADPAPTDAQEAALVAAIGASAPPGPAAPAPDPQTPTSAALTGAATWATAYHAAHPDEKTAIVLFTDGEPVGCETNPSVIASIAADAHAQGVTTYVIGLSGASEAVLEQIATAGGTDAFFVSNGSSLADDLLASLRAVAQGQ